MATMFIVSHGHINLDAIAHTNRDENACLILRMNHGGNVVLRDPPTIARLTAALDRMAESHWANEPTPTEPAKPEGESGEAVYQRAIEFLAEHSSYGLLPLIGGMATIFQVSEQTLILDVNEFKEARRR